MKNTEKFLEFCKSIRGIYTNGNISVKSDGLMSITNSNRTIFDAIIKGHFSVLDTSCGMPYCSTEEDYINWAEKIKTTVTTDLPSIEYGMHLSIPYTYVMHFHSVEASAILCSQDGSSIIQHCFMNASFDSAYVPYREPGHQLSNAFRILPKCSAYFLENHGVTIAGDSVEEIKTMYHSVQSALGKYLTRSFYLYPEAVVFPEKEQENSDKILKLMKDCKLMPRPLSLSHVRSIQRSKYQQYRQQQ